MREFGVTERNITVEKQSGKDFERPGCQRLVRKLKAGNTLVIKRIDRNYDEIWSNRERPLQFIFLNFPFHQQKGL